MSAKPEKIQSVIQEFSKFHQMEQDFSTWLNTLKALVGRVEEKLDDYRLQKEMQALWLKANEVDPDKVLASLSTEPITIDKDIDIDSVVQLLISTLVRKKSLKGKALLDAFAREMVRSGKPMGFADMITWLDDHGYERPGDNYRNNLISLITKNKDRFIRVDRGRYYVTEQEEALQRKALDEEEEGG